MLRKILLLSLMSCFMALVNAQTKHNGHEYVDLGLSVKWATCNVGASRPEESGGYYAWGEMEEKDYYYYAWSTYKWCKGTYDTMTKYCEDSKFGTVDNKSMLSASDDVAHVKWGGNWRMPSKAQQDELRSRCKWTWTTKNGVKGYKVVGPNGNSIFLPAAGICNIEGLVYAGSSGYYWSSSLFVSSTIAYSLNFDSSEVGRGVGYRCYGLSVRAVCP